MDDNETNAPTITPELLPCPLCGSDAERRDELTKGIEGVVSCTNCGGCNFASEWSTRNEADALRSMLADAEEIHFGDHYIVRQPKQFQRQESWFLFRELRDASADEFLGDFDTALLAYAAIKPNAADGEEKQDGK